MCERQRCKWGGEERVHPPPVTEPAKRALATRALSPPIRSSALLSTNPLYMEDLELVSSGYTSFHAGSSPDPEDSRPSSIVIDEAITEEDDDGTVYTAFGFLVTWRGVQSAGYRRFKEFRALHIELETCFPGNEAHTSLTAAALAHHHLAHRRHSTCPTFPPQV